MSVCEFLAKSKEWEADVLLWCYLRENSCNSYHFAVKCIWKMENMLDICSANSYQQCSRSIWFSGFLRIQHSSLTYVVNYLEISNSSVLWQSESTAQVNCSLSKDVMLLFSMETLFQRALFSLQKWVFCLCFRGCLSVICRRLDSVVFWAPWCTGKKLKQILIPGKHSFYLSAYGYQPDDCSCINEGYKEEFQILSFYYVFHLLCGFKKIHCILLIPLKKIAKAPVQKCKIFRLSFCSPTEWGKLLVIGERSEKLWGQVARHL